MRVVIASEYPVDKTRISGGVEAVAVCLTEGLRRFCDLKVYIVTLQAGLITPRTLTDDGLTIHYLPMAAHMSYLATWIDIRRLRRTINALKPDIVHAQVAGKYGLAAIGAGPPVVLTLHGIRFLEVRLWPGFLNRIYRGSLISYMERTCVQKAQHIISISPYVNKVFDGQIKGTIYAVENPIADAFFAVPDQTQPGRILFTGRLIPRKGVLTLLQAFDRVRRIAPGVTLHLAGDSEYAHELHSYYDQLQTYVAEAELGHCVSFLGHLDDTSLQQEYAECAFLVLPSIQETAPMVVEQAMAAGKAVVATRVGGLPYLVEDGQTGLLVELGDIEGLAAALIELLSDDDRRRAMGRRAREQAERRFHTDVVATQTREVYYRVAEAEGIQVK